MRVMQTNFVGVLNVTNAVLPHMRNRREGLIVFIGSRSAFRTDMIVSHVYPQFVVSLSHSRILPT
jgi:NADP-dependent 3-hydroxy acid dehydrogenase YdfG